MRNNWTEKELVVALWIYYKISFKKIHYTHPEIQNLSKIINRTPSALALKLVNYARLDPDLQEKNISGMAHGSKRDIEIWNEYYGKWELLAFTSEKILAEYKNQPIEISSGIDLFEIPKEGLERETVVRTRVNQKFFRYMVMACYENKCCITGIDTPQLLIASHIKPWALDTDNRMNPRNSLCLNMLHDKAFDKGLITVSTDLKVIVSDRILSSSNENMLSFFKPFHGKKITLPSKYEPEKEFLNYHNCEVFNKFKEQ